MSYEFDVGYDYISGFQAPVLTNKEKSTFLTKAQEEVVMDYYRRDAYNEERNKVLDELKEPVNITSFSAGPYPNSWAMSLDLSANFRVLAVINERANLSKSSVDYTNVAVKPIDDDYYKSNIDNPFKKPSLDLIWRIGYGSSLISGSPIPSHVYILPDASTTIVSMDLHVYKRPSPIIIHDSTYSSADGEIDGVLWSAYTASDSDCALHIIAHRKIVDVAVRMAYAAIQEEKGYQLSSIEEKQKENV